jgi:hypothetical protein
MRGSPRRARRDHRGRGATATRCFRTNSSGQAMPVSAKHRRHSSASVSHSTADPLGRATPYTGNCGRFFIKCGIKSSISSSSMR